MAEEPGARWRRKDPSELRAQEPVKREVPKERHSGDRPWWAKKGSIIAWFAISGLSVAPLISALVVFVVAAGQIAGQGVDPAAWTRAVLFTILMVIAVCLPFFTVWAAWKQHPRVLVGALAASGLMMGLGFGLLGVIPR